MIKKYSKNIDNKHLEMMNDEERWDFYESEYYAM